MKDLDWVQKIMMIPNQQESLGHGDFELHHRSNYKITDTTLGGNFAINPPPQFTPTADLRASGSINAGFLVGMGRKYSSMIDDNSQIIHLRMGVPQFNSLTTFFTGFYDRKASLLARTGRGEMGVFERAGNLVGMVLAAPIIPIVWAGNIFRHMVGKPTHKYYYSKASMPVYWVCVNNIVNIITTNDGIGAIDVFRIANRAQQKANELRNNATHMRRDTGASLADFKRFGSIEGNMPRRSPLEDHLRDWIKEEAGGKDMSQGEEAVREDVEENKGSWSKFATHAKSSLDGGTEFASFRVNHTGESSDTFNNQTVEPEIKSKFNNMSGSAASTRFNFAEGNIGGGFIGSMVEGAVGALGDFVKGAISGMQMHGLIALAGNAFVDIPDRWQDSTADLASMSYTMELRTPYGNPMSRLHNIWMPLAMILAAGLPKAAGPASYTWPFLVELYDKGRIQTRMGMIDSISITRGVGNVGWTQEDQALGVTVDFTVKDLSSILAMPVGMNPGIFDESTLFTDYLAALGSLDVNDQAYAIQELKMNFNRAARVYSRYLSPAYWGTQAAGTLPGRIYSSIIRTTSL